MKSTYVRDVNGIELHENDRVLYEVERNSSLYSTWGQIRNSHHGKYRIHGTIKFEDGKFIIQADQKEHARLKRPRGREKFKQNVWFEKQDLSEAREVEKVSGGDLSRPLNRYEILTEETHAEKAEKKEILRLNN